MITGLNNAALKCYQQAANKGFYDKGPPPVPERLMLMVSELAEALEEFRAGRGLKEIYYKEDADGNNKPEGVVIELADTLIRILDFCGANDLDLENALEIKTAYNTSRKYRHGGKVC